MDRASILEQLHKHGITSLEQLADRAVEAAKKSGHRHPKVNVSDVLFSVVI